MKLDYFQALKRVNEARGAWVLHGQEPLLEQNLLDAFRSSWANDQIERQRYDLKNVNDWKNVFSALNSLSLFSQNLAIEVHGNIKPDANTLKLLKNYIQHNEHNLLLIIMPKQDSSGLKSAFFQTIDANGISVNLQLTYAQDRQNVLKLEADRIGVQLSNEAWSWLEQHHEHNLLAAKNSLIQVSDTFSDQKTIDIHHLEACLQDQSRYNLYDFSDSLLAGQLSQSIKILNYLTESGEPDSLILWTLAKEMRLLMQLYEQPQQALQLGIWKNKIPAYQKALRRLNPQVFLTWPDLILEIDSAVKGISKSNTKDLFLRATANLCGISLLENAQN